MQFGGMQVIDCNNHVKSSINFFGPSCAVNSLIDKYNPIGVYSFFIFLFCTLLGVYHGRFVNSCHLNCLQETTLTDYVSFVLAKYLVVNVQMQIPMLDLKVHSDAWWKRGTLLSSSTLLLQKWHHHHLTLVSTTSHVYDWIWTLKEKILIYISYIFVS